MKKPDERDQEDLNSYLKGFISHLEEIERDYSDWYEQEDLNELKAMVIFIKDKLDSKFAESTDEYFKRMYGFL